MKDNKYFHAISPTYRNGRPRLLYDRRVRDLCHRSVKTVPWWAQIISDVNGESWSDDFPYEITHVAYYKDGVYRDVKGIRALSDMAQDFHLYQGGYRITHLSPDEFMSYMGDDDDYPIYGNENDIQEAIEMIRSS